MRRPSSKTITVGDLVRDGARRFARARLVYGHGTDNAIDESAALVFHALGLEHADAAAVYARTLDAPARRRVERLFERRIRERIPAAYLMRRMWFMGLEFFVDQRVLVPRSPLAELIEKRFAPWIPEPRVRAILDIGTGSGCIAVACAVAFPRARVDAVDISRRALAVARRNIRRHRVSARVRALHSNHYAAVRSRRYDVIVSNPPYVGHREMRALPREYRHEPALALASGKDGLDSARVILREAAAHLRPGGILVLEVGNSESALHRAFPQVPFTWLEFARGGGGVLVLTREVLEAYARDFEPHRSAG
jgi:ribosomal protein L3 glutamine methyltransferase